MRTLLFLVLLIATISLSHSQIALRGLVSRDGLNYAITETLGFVCDAIKKIEIPDVITTQHVGGLGNVDINVTSIHITEAKIEQFQVTTKPGIPNIVGFSSTGVHIRIDLAWSVYQQPWPHVRGSGTANAISDGATISLQVEMGITKDNKPSLKTNGPVVVNLGKMKLSIEGGGALGWLLGVLEGLFESKIQESTQDAIRSAIEDGINQGFNQAMESTSFVVHVPIPQKSGLDIDLSLPDAPHVTASGDAIVIDTEAKTCPPGKKPCPNPPFQPVSVPDALSLDPKFLNVYITDWIAKDAAWTIFNQGELTHFHVTPDMVPPESPIKLNTTDLKNYLPDLYTKYPNRGVVLDLSVAQAPKIDVTQADGVKVNANVTILFSVLLDGQKTEKAFLLDSIVDVQVPKFGVVSTNKGLGLNITGEIAPVKFEFTVLETYIGKVDVSRLALMANIIINNGLIPKYNAQLSAGVPIELPPGLNLTKATIELRDHYAALGGIISYSPQPGSLMYRVLRQSFMSKREKEIRRKFKCDEGLNRFKTPCQPLWDFYYLQQSFEHTPEFVHHSRGQRMSALKTPIQIV